MTKSGSEPHAYDVAEAVRVLSDGKHARQPITSAPKEKSRALADAIAEAAKQAGFNASVTAEKVVIADDSTGFTERIGVIVTDGVVRIGTVSTFGPFDHGLLNVPRVHYDAAAAAYISTEDDTFYVPAPGAPRRRRSPVAVAAQAVQDLFAALHERKMSGQAK